MMIMSRNNAIAHYVMRLNREGDVINEINAATGKMKYQRVYFRYELNEIFADYPPAFILGVCNGKDFDIADDYFTIDKNGRVHSYDYDGIRQLMAKWNRHVIAYLQLQTHIETDSPELNDMVNASGGAMFDVDRFYSRV